MITVRTTQGLTEAAVRAISDRKEGGLRPEWLFRWPAIRPYCGRGGLCAEKKLHAPTHALELIATRIAFLISHFESS